MYWSISRVRPAVIAVVLACLCLVVSGCSVADHTAVDLPVRITFSISNVNPILTTRIPLPGSLSPFLSSGIGDGSSLLVSIDTQYLPDGLTPDDIGAAALSIPVSSRSLVSGSASFAIYVRELYPSPGSESGSRVHESVPEGAKPLSICSLSHDPSVTVQAGPNFTITGPDTSVKHMNFNITEALKAWVGGTPYAGLVIVQRGAPPSNGPRWQISNDPSKGTEGPRVVVWVKRPEQPPAQ